MDDHQALRIITALANGTDPDTGEVFAENSPYQRALTVRALLKAQTALEQQSTRDDGGAKGSASPLARSQEHPRGTSNLGMSNQGASKQGASNQGTSNQGTSNPRNSSATNAGKPWSTEEDRQLLALFDAEQSLADIARAHGRTVNGVRARLEKHGRLEPSSATRWPAASSAERSQSDRRPQRGDGSS